MIGPESETMLKVLVAEEREVFTHVIGQQSLFDEPDIGVEQ